MIRRGRERGVFAFARHPELTFYVYYIQKDTDLDFETRQKTDLSDYLMPRLLLPEERKGVYEIDDFGQYARYFYRTDGHWCHEGSYAGYRQLVELLGCAGTPLEPVGDAVLVRDDFSGKKASAIAGEGVFTEPFYAYRFDWPDLTVTINGQPAEPFLREHYAHIADKPYFPATVEYMTSGPVVAMVVEGEQAIQGVRHEKSSSASALSWLSSRTLKLMFFGGVAIAVQFVVEVNNLPESAGNKVG